MERVLWPMEPVEPRMASFFTSSIFADLRLLAGKACFERGEALSNVDGEVELFGEMLNCPGLIFVAQLHLGSQRVDRDFDGFKFRNEEILNDVSK